MVTRYAIGVDFGTESGRGRPRRRRRRAAGRDGRPALPQRRHRRAAAVSGPATSPCRPTGRSRIPRTTCASSRTAVPAVAPRRRRSTPRTSSASASTSRRARCSRSRPTARRSCDAARASAPTRMPGSSSGSTTRRSPRPTGSTRSRATTGQAMARPLRRQDLVRVVLLEGAPDPRRGARGLRGGRPAHRGGRLGRLAAHRRRDPQRLHGRLQGDVVEARRLPDAERTSRALDPRFADVVDDEDAARRPAAGRARPAGSRRRRPAWTGLPPGTAVAVANVDAHVAVPAATVVEPGRMVMIMGTSTCHMVLGHGRARPCPACAATSRTAIIPGLFGYEAGQSCVGDHFAWFVEHGVPAAYRDEARDRGLDLHALLQEKAGAAAGRRVRPAGPRLVERQPLRPRRCGRSSGLLVGATLATTPEEIYRALIEATAFGTRVIIETFEANGVPIHEIVACGGLAEKSPLIMQIYADVTGRPFRVSASDQTPALGLGDVRGGGRRRRRPAGTPRSRTRRAAMARLKDRGLPSRSREHADLRRPLPRVRAAARLLRSRRERRDEDAAGAAGAREGRAARSRWRPDDAARGASRGAGRAPRRAATPRARRLDRRQRQRARPGDRARRDQAVGRPLRGPDRRVDGRRSTSTARIVEGAFHPSSDTASHLVHLPAPPRRQRRRPHALALRDRVRRGRPADPGLPDGPGRRVRRRDPVRRVRADRRRGDRRRWSSRASARSPAILLKQPRRLHDRRHARRPRSRPR